MADKQSKLAESQSFVLSLALLIGGGMLFHYIPAIVLGTGAIGYMIYDYAKDLFVSAEVTQLQRFFQNCALQNKEGELPRLVNRADNNIGSLYTFSIPIGLSQKDFFSHEDKFKCYFNAPVKITQGSNLNQVQLQVLTNNFNSVYPVRLDEPPISEMRGKRFAIGVKQSAQGEVPVYIDYDKCEGHILISGGTGSGKSTVLRLI